LIKNENTSEHIGHPVRVLGFYLIFLRTGVMLSIAMSVCVCLYVSLSVRSHISRTTITNFTKMFCVRNCGPAGSVLLWRQWNALCTSGFVDNVMVSHNGANIAQNQRHSVEFARWRHWCCPIWKCVIHSMKS